MVNMRHLLVKFKLAWNDLRHLARSYLNYWSNRSLDLIMIGGGIHPIPGAEPWKRKCLTLYRLLGFYQLIMALARVGFSIQRHDDLVEMSSSIVLAVAMIASCANVFLLDHYGEVARQSREFISSNFSRSGDPDYDASVRRNAVKFAGKVILAIFLILCCDQVMICVPNSARDRIFGIPKEFHALGFVAARLLRETFVFMIPIFWGCLYFSCPLTVLPLLMGLRSELMIVARGFESIEARVQAQVLEDLNSAAGTSRNLQPNVLRWKYLKQILGITVEQLVEALLNIHLVQPFVSIVYAITYYSAMLVVLCPIFMIIKSGLTLVSLLLTMSAVALIVECYFWCCMVESIQETMKSITISTAQLASGLEHSLENHSEYIQMRTSLMIIQINASHEGWFSSGGVISISVKSFGDLCMFIYRFTTFLLTFD